MVDLLTATPTAAKEIGRKTGTIKTRLWIKLPISFWALLEQIRTHPVHETFDNVDSDLLSLNLPHPIQWIITVVLFSLNDALP